MKSTYVKLFKELLSEAAPPVVPDTPKIGTYNTMGASSELIMNKSGGGFNNQDKKTRFGTGFGLLSDADYEVLRQKGLQYGIDIDTMPNAYQAANIIRQNDMANYTQNLANSMGIGSGHQYVPYRSTYQNDASQQQSMEQQIDPYGFGIGGRSQGFEEDFDDIEIQEEFELEDDDDIDDDELDDVDENFYTDDDDHFVG